MIDIAGAWNGGRVFSGRQIKYRKASIKNINIPTNETYIGLNIKSIFWVKSFLLLSKHNMSKRS